MNERAVGSVLSSVDLLLIFLAVTIGLVSSSITDTSVGQRVDKTRRWVIKLEMERTFLFHLFWSTIFNWNVHAFFHALCRKVHGPLEIERILFIRNSIVDQ